MGVVATWAEQTTFLVELLENVLCGVSVNLVAFGFIEHIIVLSDAVVVRSERGHDVEH